MLPMNWFTSCYEPSPVMIRALRSLTQQHVDAVQAALPVAWSVDQHDDYDGYLSIVVAHGHDSGTTPAFLISGTTGHIELAELGDDVLNPVGRFATIEATIAELTAAIANQT